MVTHLDHEKEHMKEVSKKLQGKVKIHFFRDGGASSQFNYAVLKEISKLTDKLELKVYEFQNDLEALKYYDIDMAPAITLEGSKLYGIRYFGKLERYETALFIEDLLDVSRGSTSLLIEAKDMLDTIDKPLHLQVFVTPTCPYCQQAVRMAHKLALMSDRVVADMISAVEFPHLVKKYSIKGVPMVVVNDGEAEFLALATLSWQDFLKQLIPKK